MSYNGSYHERYNDGFDYEDHPGSNYNPNAFPQVDPPAEREEEVVRSKYLEGQPQIGNEFLDKSLMNVEFDGLGPSSDDDVNGTGVSVHPGNTEYRQPFGQFPNEQNGDKVPESSSGFRPQFDPQGLMITQDTQQEPINPRSQDDMTYQNTSNNISFNFPGAFKDDFNDDQMEIDDSPPFTIELDLYFDSTSQNKDSEVPAREALFPHNQYFSQMYRNQFLAQALGLALALAQAQSRHHSKVLQSPELQVQSHNIDDPSPSSNMNLSNVNTPNPTTNSAFNTPSANQFGYNVNTGQQPSTNLDQTPNSNMPQFVNDNQVDDGSIYSSFINENESIPDNSNFLSGNNSNNLNHLRNPSMDSHFNPPSISINPNLNVNYNVNELSPLTTTTSLTPSINSIHSTQPSFFSAHQYLPRQSIELTNSNRNSIDLYSKARNSIDSNSNQPQRQQRNNSGRYLSFTNSISNYIPFMSDKNNQRNGGGSPRSNSNSPSTNNGSGGLLDNTFMNQSQSSPTPRQQPKHLIRSIFKSNPANAGNNNPEDSNFNGVDGVFSNNQPDMFGENGHTDGTNITSNEYLLMSPPKEEPEMDNLDPLPNKKLKRPKRSLFNRFKGPVKQESTEELDVSNDSASKHSGGNNSLNHESEDINLDTSFHGNMSRTPSSANTVRTNNNNSNSMGSQPNLPFELQDQQPDYAALFENVGKRKKVSKTSTFNKSKPKPKTKNGKKSGKFDKDFEESLENIRSSGSGDFEGDSSTKIESYDQFLGLGDLFDSSVLSQTSHPQHVNKEGQESSEDQNSSNPIANASKRILSSKLMRRKGSANPSNSSFQNNEDKEASEDSAAYWYDNAEPELKSVKTKVMNDGVETEVDLKTLDIPDDTQPIPSLTVNGKNKTRGRKENKQADLVDLTKIYLCNYCSRRFKRQEHLKRHFRSLHTHEKPYDCTICHKKFSRSDNLNQHLKTHKEEEVSGLLIKGENSDQLSQVSEEASIQ